MEIETDNKMKFCKYCGEKIPDNAILCTHCGRQVEELKQSQFEQPKVIINNNNSNINNNVNGIYGTPKNKWISLLLCIFVGFLGAHKFYEGKILLGLVYLFTFGLFGIGLFFDFFSLLFKPNPYYP